MNLLQNQAPLTIGLRFPRSQVRVLNNVIDGFTPLAAKPEVRSLIGLMRQAKDAASKGEPLIVACEKPEEAIAMAHGFVQYGIAMPAIEDLTARAG